MEWSLRGTGREIGQSVNTVRTILRAHPELSGGQQLTAFEVVTVRALAELGANRPVPRGSRDERSVTLLARDASVIEALRDAYRSGGLDERTRLLATNEKAWVVARDHEALAALEDHPDQPLHVLPVGRWFADLAGAAAAKAS